MYMRAYMVGVDKTKNLQQHSNVLVRNAALSIMERFFSQVYSRVSYIAIYYELLV